MRTREILGEILDRQIIAKGSSVKIKKQLEKQYGKGAWRKMKGIAQVRLADGAIRQAEIHWFESHGIGKRHIKVKRYL